MTTYSVIFRTGGTERFQWQRAFERYTPATLNKARKLVGAIKRSGYAALIVADSELEKKGLPKTYRAPKGYAQAGRAQVRRSNPRRKRPQAVARARAIQKSAQFHGFIPRRLHRIRITWPKAMFIVGAAVRIDYLSDKFDGKKRIYWHDFAPRSRVVVMAAESPQPDGDNLLVLKGKFKINERGLIG